MRLIRYLLDLFQKEERVNIEALKALPQHKRQQEKARMVALAERCRSQRGKGS